MKTINVAEKIPVATLPVSGERRVYIVDDNPDIRRSLHFSLAAIGVVGWSFVCAQDLLDQLETLKPGPMLLDVRMPGTDGIELLTLLNERHVGWPVIMMSAHGDIPIAVRSIRLGAIDFLEKPFKFSDLEMLLVNAYADLDGAVRLQASRSEAREAWKKLSPREVQVLELLVTGALNKIVADKLGLSVRTIEVHRARGMEKLGVKSLAQVVAVRFAANAQIY